MSHLDGSPSRRPAVPTLAAGRRRVLRPRLVDLVDGVTTGQTVAIAAPAGWGKSELLASWDEHRRSSMATAWISLEAGDQTPRRFWRRFLAAVSNAEWADAHAFRLLELAPDREVDGEQVVRAVVDRVSATAEPLAIIIDDVHELSGSGSAEDLSLLLRHRPPAWHLVLSGRSLPLPLMRLRVAGLLTSLGPSELAFDLQEAAELLDDAGCRLAPDEVADVVACTEGWAAGLRLAAMPLARGVSVEQVVAGVRAGQHDVERYFQEEVVGSLPPHVADFLLSTSIAPTLNARLARHLSGRDDAGVLLQSLAESGVFTAADRSQPGSYRYHPLLAGSLERFLATNDPQRHHALHRAAARWYHDRGSPALSFGHAVACEDWDLCAELMDDLWIPMFVGGDTEGLASLLNVLPRRAVQTDPALRALQALLMLDRADCARVADQAVFGPTTTRAELVLAIEAARRAGRVDVARQAAKAVLAQLPTGSAAHAHLRAFVLLSLGVSEYWASDRAAAERDLREALAEAEREGLDYIRLGCLSQLVGVLTAQNRVNDADELADVAAALALKRGWEGSGWAAELWHARGWICYVRCELDRAVEYLDRAEGSVWRQDAVVGAIIPTIKALVVNAAGREAEAKALLDLANARLPADREQYVFLAYIDAELARHAVRRGELARARQMLSGGVVDRSLYHCVAMAELLIAEGQTDRARRTLARGLDEADGYLDERLHAMALLGSIERPDVARAILREAMQMGATDRYVQPFCQVGASIMPLVAELGRAHRGLRALAAEIRERFAERQVEPRPQLTDGVEALTSRELDVLRQLEGHDTLNEVAAKLHVSPNTLKVHTRHLYEKLGVRSRREALAEAARRGLL